VKFKEGLLGLPMWFDVMPGHTVSHRFGYHQQFGKKITADTEIKHI